MPEQCCRKGPTDFQRDIGCFLPWQNANLATDNTKTGSAKFVHKPKKPDKFNPDRLEWTRATNT